MNVLDLDARRFFLLGMRIFFGLWLLYAGLMKWIPHGPQPFVTMIADMFKETWSPHPLNVALAWLIAIAEPILALFLLIGLRPRLIWTLTTLLMFILLMGQSMLMRPDVGWNFFYLLITLTCAALAGPDHADRSSRHAPTPSIS